MDNFKNERNPRRAHAGKPMGRLVALDGGREMAPYEQYRLLYLPALDIVLKEAAERAWSMAAKQKTVLEPWLFAVAVECLHEALLRRQRVTDPSRSRLADINALQCNYSNLDSLTKTYPLLYNELQDDEKSLHEVLRGSCGLAADSQQYRLAVVLFRMGWLAMTDNFAITNLLELGHRRARTG